MSAAFFLQQTKTWASRMFLALSTILVLFSLVQASLDVASAVVFLRLPGLSGGSPEQAVLYKRLFWTRAALVAFNNAIADCLFLYRCAVIWRSSPYYKVVIAIPAVLIISTLAMGLWAVFVLTTNSPDSILFRPGHQFYPAESDRYGIPVPP
ncbi:hypothetical protein B0H14DRAFT_3453796 [Mycena olivaceomarginata]|nr:hypothetical protein B0H14DRAFT_3453796 [Mycena olivaceomarginata]